MDAVEAYLDQVKARLVAEPMQKEAIVSELRSHLWEQVHDLRQRDPDAPEPILLERLVQRFGAPEDVARAYEPEVPPEEVPANRSFVVVFDGAWLQELRRTGAAARAGAERGLARIQAAGARTAAWTRRSAPRTSRAVGRMTRLLGRFLVWLLSGLGQLLLFLGRSLGTTAKWIAISFLVLTTIVLGMALLAGAFLFDDIRAEVEARQEMRVLGVKEDCWTHTCATGPTTAAFYVPQSANRLTFDLRIDPHPDNAGHVQLTVTDPAGEVMLERGLDGDRTSKIDETHRWATEPGHWTLHYETDDYQGWLRAATNVRGI